MNKIKVIDLLNRIANGEEVPENINYTHRVFGRDTMMVCKENIINKLDTGAIELNDEVEIIEEDKKIGKIGTIYYSETPTESILHNKIDEIIDVLNEMREDK